MDLIVKKNTDLKWRVELLATCHGRAEVKGWPPLDVVVRERPVVLELLASEAQSLLVKWDSFLVLDLCLHNLDGVRRLYLKSEILASCLDDDEHVVWSYKTLFVIAFWVRWSTFLSAISSPAVTHLFVSLTIMVNVTFTSDQKNCRSSMYTSQFLTWGFPSKTVICRKSNSFV